VTSAEIAQPKQPNSKSASPKCATYVQTQNLGQKV